MNLVEYIANLQRFANEHPEALSEEVVVVHASDDEGNSHHKVVFTPTLGKFEDNYFDDKAQKINAICIN